ncbi:NUDIX hydrolase [Paenibacillus larvae]|uniref:NUDIX hydrolase n=1 Tax=Paenibacillus larvae TaxID=1464 RepID=UPI002282A91B|nr:NUDIX domain-containing protein [Paenibacillus larvae]MCY7477222.1 NUDIX domain-containing protein [Paenibacillus larvae]MDE5165828.1 NUDIX domain-containing protein [Paenibacillus larvae subsp. larvae]
MKEISAGGVVFTHTGDGLRIQMIQDRFGKMTLAKGKREAGETIRQTAVREIREETGIQVRLVEPLQVVTYEYILPSKITVNKEVHYFLAEAEKGILKAQIEEIGSVSWLTPQVAWSKQLEAGYDNNDAVMRLALNKLGIEV